MREGPLVVVVDDDASIRKAVARLLKAAGFATVAFEDAESFLRSDSRTTAACVVADMRMPGMTGLQMYRELVSEGRRIPTIIISAHLDPEAQTSMREEGISGFLAKPFKREELLNCVHRALDGASPPRDGPGT
jgi:FixJ family two-component response regulator